MQCIIILYHSFCFPTPLGTAGSSSNSTWYYELSVLKKISPSSSLVLPSASEITASLTSLSHYLTTSLLHYYYNPPLPPAVILASLTCTPPPHNSPLPSAAIPASPTSPPPRDLSQPDSYSLALSRVDVLVLLSA
jgi:hypothetical protein